MAQQELLSSEKLKTTFLYHVDDKRHDKVSHVLWNVFFDETSSFV